MTAESAHTPSWNSPSAQGLPPRHTQVFTGLRNLWLLGALAVGVLGADLLSFANGGGGDDGSADDIVVIKFLESSGADEDGTARARWRDKTDEGQIEELDFSVELEDMPAGDYDLYVTDLVIPKGVITVDVSGEGEIEFATPLDDPKPLFDFAVFDQVIEVRQGATIFFTDTFDDQGGGGGGTSGGESKTKTEIFLVNVATDLDFDAKGKVKHEVKKNETKLTLEVEKLIPGTYTVLVGGEPVSELTTVDASAVEIEFQNPVDTGKTLLNFDPLGKVIEVESDGVVYLTGVLPGPNSDTGTKPPTSAKKGAKDVGKSKGDELLVYLLNLGVTAGAQGHASLSQNPDPQFEVTIEDVVAGDYGLSVNGVEEGTITVGALGIGSIIFNEAPGVGESLLDFDVKGQLIEVTSGADVILATIYPVSAQAALGKLKKETFKNTKVKVNLINAGEDLDATGTVQWTLKGNGDNSVTIDLKDLPPGVYTVVIDSVPAASTITVGANGKGKLTWDTTPKGKQVLLDFDPIDAGVQIQDAGAVVQLSAVIDVP
jgi:hypothetical protein